jgi:hypothetical protein
LCQRASKEEMIISYKEENKMASYLRPRRGQKSTAETQAIVLKKGEVFFEIGNGGTPTTYASSAAVATGKSFGKIKMGNGTNTYQTLGYFIDVDTTVVAWTDPYPNNATSAAQGSQLYANLNAINTSANVKTIFNNIKSLLYKMATQVTKLNNDLSNRGTFTNLGGIYTDGTLTLTKSLSNFKYVKVYLIKGGTNLVVASCILPITTLRTINSDSKRYILGTYIDVLYEGDFYYKSDTQIELSHQTNAALFFDGIK